MPPIDRLTSEQPDRDHEPEAGDRPAVPSAPHRDADGRWLTAAARAWSAGSSDMRLTAPRSAGRRDAARWQSTRSAPDDEVGPTTIRPSRRPRTRAARRLRRGARAFGGGDGSNGSIPASLDRRRAGSATAREHAVDQERAHRRAVAGRERDAPPGGMIRDRSAWPISTLSYSGRKRGGAGVSGSGRGASGRSNSSRPPVVAEGREARPQAIDDCSQPGQARPRLGVLTVAGPNAAR